MHKSTVVDNKTGRSIDSQVRTSSGTFLSSEQDEILARIEKRVAQVTMIPIGACCCVCVLCLVCVRERCCVLFFLRSSIQAQLQQHSHVPLFHHTSHSIHTSHSQKTRKTPRSCTTNTVRSTRYDHTPQTSIWSWHAMRLLPLHCLCRDLSPAFSYSACLLAFHSLVLMTYP